jgi:hypothetical protein
VVGCFEDSNEPLGSIKAREYLGNLCVIQDTKRLLHVKLHGKVWCVSILSFDNVKL